LAPLTRFGQRPPPRHHRQATANKKSTVPLEVLRQQHLQRLRQVYLYGAAKDNGTMITASAINGSGGDDDKVILTSCCTEPSTCSSESSLALNVFNDDGPSPSKLPKSVVSDQCSSKNKMTSASSGFCDDDDDDDDDDLIKWSLGLITSSS
jgi:hypothetical protein